MRNIIIALIILLALCAGTIRLQLFLSKKGGRWPGLILPIVSFGVSLLYLVNVQNTGEPAAFLTAAALVLLLCNIPTAVLLAIYAACRKSRSKEDA